MNTKRILVTGAAGFIGFHLSRALKKEGHFVFGMDNFNNYYNPQLKHDRANILATDGITVATQDIGDKEIIAHYIRQYQISHVVHLAAQAGVRYSITHPEAYIKTNIEGFLHILEACRQAPGIRLVYASSSSVYGCNEKIPFSIHDATDKPANMYAVSKKTKELMATSYYHLYGLASVGLRFFTVYGPWGRPDMAYFSFTKDICEGIPINLYNGGAMQRDFTYIDDVVVAICKSLDVASGCHLFNIGNNHPESVETLVALIERYTGRKAIKNMLPKPVGEIETTYADITESQNILGFVPQTSLEKGMQHFVDWYQHYCIDKKFSDA